MTHSFRWGKTPKFYINLARRPDRAKKVEEEFDKHNLDVSWWPAQDWQETTVPSDSIKLSEPNAAGILACAMSHVSLIRYARDNGFKAIVIFEDDIEFSEDFADKIKYIEGIDEPWDMFYLGCHSYHATPTKHENIFRVDVAAGTYSYILKSSLYEFILSKWNFHRGMDEFFDYEVLKSHTALAILPPIVNTFPNFSDVANKNVNYFTQDMKYITITEFQGRRANQYWTVACLFGLARKYGYEPIIPSSWEFRSETSIPDKYYGDLVPEVRLQEKVHGYDPKFFEGVTADKVGIKGCFQSYKWWEDIKDEIYSYLRPKEATDFGKWSVACHIRKTDYLNNKAYVQYDIDYYKSAMKKYFSDPRYVFYIISDDYKYIESHFEHSERYIMAYRTPYEDFCNLASCQNFILSGSSFSFWGAFLSPGGGRTYRVPRTHAGHLADLDESSSYMPNWIIHHDKNNVVLCCYADNKYKTFQDRLVQQNEKDRQFDSVHAYNREWLETTDFYKQNKELLDLERGGGYWAWKPYIILESLQKLEEGDLLLYLDSADLFVGNIREFLIRELSEKYMILTEGWNVQKDWTKRDCFVEMDCDGPEYWDAFQVEAGVIAMRNCSKTRKIVKEWMEWCCKPSVVNDDASKKPNAETYVEHRHDQSILTIEKVLHDIPTSSAIREYAVCNVDDKVKEKISLKQCTFIIPCKMDSSDRNENMVACINWINSNFDTNIIVGEQGTHEFEYVKDMGCKYMWFDMEFFHRTRILNLMTVEADTNIIFNHDADVFLCVKAVVEAVKLLESGVPFVLPYSGAFLHASRKFHRIINTIGCIEPFINMPFKGRNDNSVGGSNCFRRDLWILENENFRGHSPEDRFRAAFAKILYGELVRLDYPLIHLDHFIGPDSSHATNDWAVFNNSETRRCKSLKTKEQVLEYVNSWPFYHEHKSSIQKRVGECV